MSSNYTIQTYQHLIKTQTTQKRITSIHNKNHHIIITTHKIAYPQQVST